MLILEVIGFYFSNSLALISDAGHLLSDALALALAVFAGIMSMRPATQKISYGWHRIEILAAGFNGGSLIVIAIWIIYEAISRMQSPPTIDVHWLLPIAVVGLIGNIISAFILHRTGDVEKELNLKGAYLHVLGDALGSVGTIIAAACIWVWDLYIIDPIISMMIALIISRSGWFVLKEAIFVLMESTPDHINTQQLKQDLKKIEHVLDVHDLHVWSLTSDVLAMTCHLRVQDNQYSQHILRQALELLHTKYDLEHCTIQIETIQIVHSELHT
jgi:cobalt-zinc-cadmium efflux system protein